MRVSRQVHKDKWKQMEAPTPRPGTPRPIFTTKSSPSGFMHVTMPAEKLQLFQ